MKIFSTPEFKNEFEKLIKNNSYKYLSKELIDTYIDKDINDCIDGTRLNADSPNPFIKKRIRGSGGSRLYFLALIIKDSIYFAFVHPKSGSAGYENINNDKKAQLLQDVYDCINENNLFEISCCDKKKNVLFNVPEPLEEESA